MLSSTAIQPMQLSAFWQTIVNIFSATGHGSATYTVGDDRQLIHDQTQLSFVINEKAKETPEAFIDRVRSQAEPGDVVEFTMRGGAITNAKITRSADVPIRMESGETLEAFVRKVKTYKGKHPQA